MSILMCPMEPISGVTDFVRALETAEDDELSAFPVYCALLFTRAQGLDERLTKYVRQDWWELDAMVGQDCQVFVVWDQNVEEVLDYRPFRPHEVYAVARELGVQPDAMPCACFFVDPRRSRDVLRLRLRSYLPEPPYGDDLTQTFRAIGAALRICAPRREEERLECLRNALIDQRRRIRGPRIAEESSCEGWLEEVLAPGASIAASIATLIALLL